MKKILSLLLVMFLFTVALPVYAQDQAAEENPQTQAQQDEVLKHLREQNPYLEKLRKASIEFIKEVPEDGIKPLFMIRESYGIIRSVYAVQRDVGHAVELCGNDNPDLKEEISARFSQWNQAVEPVLKDQDKNLQAAIEKQSYKNSKDVNAYLDNIDDAAEYADKMLDKKVITTEEACKSLLASMDRTEGNIVSILDEVPIPALDAEGKAIYEGDDEDSSEEEESADE
jgi:hypothetical protein